MISYVFLLGRPGCGKSVVYKMSQEKLILKNISSSRVDDFLTLKEIFDADTEFKKHIRKDGGFAVTDWSVLDEALKLLNPQLKKMKKPGHVIFIEFARDNYENALKNFDKEVLSESLVFYVYSTYEECYRRNIERFEKAKKSGHDDHIVPKHLMETYYRTDDFEKAYLLNRDSAQNRAQSLKQISGTDVAVIDSSIPGLDRLESQVGEIVNKKW